MASRTKSKVDKVDMPHEDAILKAFSLCPRLDVAKFQQLSPAIIDAAQKLADTMGVCVDLGDPKQ